MKMRIILLLIFIALPFTASAATVRQGAPGCMTYDLLDQLIDAILKDDQATGENLLSNGCLILKKDVQAKILDFHDTDLEVEISVGDSSVQMWVPGKYVDN
jgi:hypothetical protein